MVAFRLDWKRREDEGEGGKGEDQKSKAIYKLQGTSIRKGEKFQLQ